MPAPRATGYCLNVEERDACLLRRRFQAKDCRLPAAREANARVRAGDHPSCHAERIAGGDRQHDRRVRRHRACRGGRRHRLLIRGKETAAGPAGGEGEPR